jgi:hypothetical protein
VCVCVCVCVCVRARVWVCACVCVRACVCLKEQYFIIVYLVCGVMLSRQVWHCYGSNLRYSFPYGEMSGK